MFAKHGDTATADGGRFASRGTSVDVVAVSHLRWDFVYQRPQHLLSRAARRHRVLFVEEPVEGERFTLEERPIRPTLTVVVPHVPRETPAAMVDAWLASALRELVGQWRTAGAPLVVWHYAVMAEPVTRTLGAEVVVFDCMDELSLFQGASPDLAERERRLIGRADLVFTGGYSLWQAKRGLHRAVYPFPSSIDLRHFAKARDEQPEPDILRGIPRPRFVYAGVIDERIDLRLLARLAAADVGQVVLVGPIAKIDERDVPAGARVHRLGMQPYDHLPAIFAHADVGIMPFAMTEATRFISPTKTPEYLAAGLPVVSTPVHDVVRSYGSLTGAVQIAADADDFADACERAVGLRVPRATVDRHLAGQSWDTTWASMERLIEDAASGRDAA